MLGLQPLAEPLAGAEVVAAWGRQAAAAAAACRSVRLAEHVPWESATMRPAPAQRCPEWASPRREQRLPHPGSGREPWPSPHSGRSRAESQRNQQHATRRGEPPEAPARSPSTATDPTHEQTHHTHPDVVLIRVREDVLLVAHVNVSVCVKVTCRALTQCLSAIYAVNHTVCQCTPPPITSSITPNPGPMWQREATSSSSGSRACAPPCSSSSSTEAPAVGLPCCSSSRATALLWSSRATAPL
jgi:hypothetical protein